MANRTQQDTSPSIIERVRSRVSGWFSPTSSGSTEQRQQGNGNLRRRRESDTGNEPVAAADYDEQYEAPPVKKLKSFIVTQNTVEQCSQGSAASRRTIYDYSGVQQQHQDTPPYAFLRSSPLIRHPPSQKSQLNQVVVSPDMDDEEEEADEGQENPQIVASQKENVDEDEEEEDESIANGNDESASESGASISSASCNIFPPTRANASSSGGGGGGLRESSLINFGSHLQSKKSLFSDKNISISMSSLNSLSQKRQFNASLYGSTSALSDSRLLSIQSPFYRGRTMFGGASAYSSSSAHGGMRLNSPLGSRRNQIPPRPSSSLSNFSMSSANQLTGQGGTRGVSESANGNEDELPLSSTAKRILEVMNQLSGPLSDVRKMAHSSLSGFSTTQSHPPMTPHHRQRFTEQDMEAKRAIRLQQPKTPYSRSTTVNYSMPPITELQVPSMSQLLQMKKLQNQTEQLRKCASETKSSLNRVTEYKLPDTKGGQSGDAEGAKHVNKIRTKICKVRETPQDDVLPLVQLPDVQLPQLKSIPKFDISFPCVENKKNNGSTKAAAADEDLCEIDDEVNENYFAFSKPIVVGSHRVQGIGTGMFNYKFSEPINLTQKNEKITTTFNYAPELAKKLPQQKMSTGDFLNVMKAPEQQTLKIGSSVLEALKASPLSHATGTLKNSKNDDDDASKEVLPKATKDPLNVVNSFGSQFRASADTWECTACLVRNKNAEIKCIACGTSKKTDTGAKATLSSSNLTVNAATSGNSGFSAILQAQKSKWTCSSCMVQNDNTKEKCVCCEQPKPSEVDDKTTPNKAPSVLGKAPTMSTDAGFCKLVSEQKAKWECAACMTRNEHSKNRCACCEQPKPGAVADNVPQFSFSATPSTSSKFTFGIKAPVEVASSAEKDVDGSTKTVTTTTPSSSGFIFGAISSAKGNEKPASSDAASKVGFIFGNVASTAAASTTTTTSTSANMVSSAAQEAPKFVFGAAKSNVPAEATNKFVTPSVASTTTTSVAASTTIGVTSTASCGGFKFGVPTSVTSTDEVKSVVTAANPSAPEAQPATTTSATFLFAPSAGTPAVAATKEATSSAAKTTEILKPKASIIFGAPSTTSTTTVVTQPSNIFGNSSSSVFANTTGGTDVFSTTFKSSSTTSTPTFGNTATTTPKAPEEQPKKTAQLFTFGSVAEPAASTATTTPATVNPQPGAAFAFGTSEQSNKTTTGSTPFIFGGVAKAQQDDKFQSSGFQGFGGFGGQSSQVPAQSGFGSIAPTFGGAAGATSAAPFGSGSTTPALSFGAASAAPTFGAAASSGNIFGSATSSPPTFNATQGGSGGIFGNSSGSAVNKTPAVAAATPFGQLGSRGFDVNDSSIEPSTKKQQPSFDFGAPKAQESLNAPFSFGSSNNNTLGAPVEKATFNFTAGAAPNFNFTGSSQQNSSQPFSFNATPTTFNFEAGNSETGTNAPAFPIGGTNLFAATPGQAPRRKMRAVRRIQR
ncbi:nuclear pore complex protein Nup153 isoform X2 [Lutzomyia longipalpis]|uniref:nuclear pore complex protein Nup153 isoform X2 n=1 Tax=Lutzomyia longipalpis TaxID=7200 RepID=UPI002483A367|nr:nuclear pore complex protein Nup153 isoform X2 [Lutzomyia longipalpis]